ncbi:Alpha/Beta hydrolase protein [Podospora fimiseda]|uniref:Alpha/Beta hydrolase protein n=1 Tax=Podospora fimiseda TaxID=252190 RepID=A0AAN6YPG6_9PEZI|nr:Alpha/Beta hydrolase protein [Podospora fimiseda]
MDSTIKPFKINIPEEKLSQLKTKLQSAEFPDESPLSNDWEYGVPVSDLKRLLNHWQNNFDWREQEKLLNSKLPQFLTSIEIDGFGPLDIHFVHQKSTNKNSIPLLFCHGWPGSFIEVLKILPLLTSPSSSSSSPSFDVIAPSLPNFGFSSGIIKPGFAFTQYAETCHKLMLKLGYTTYATQGGDWGFGITRTLGILYPDHIIASHLNLSWCFAPKFLKNPILYLKSFSLFLTEEEKKGLERTRWFEQKGAGYYTLQSTKPSTIGLAIESSPVGLLAWIYEKLHDWTDEYPWTDDEILTWVSIYVFSKAGPAASGRIYYEVKNCASDKRVWSWIDGVKFGISVFPRDVLVSPSSYVRALGKMVFEKRHESGGHFGAWEKPEELVGDLKEMFGAV